MEARAKELFVVYDEATKLRHLGFNDICVAYYSSYKELSPSNGTSNEHQIYKKYPVCVTAPTIDQAIDFMINLVDEDFKNFCSVQFYGGGSGQIMGDEEIGFNSKKDCLDKLFKLHDKQLEERQLCEEEY